MMQLLIVATRAVEQLGAIAVNALTFETLIKLVRPFSSYLLATIFVGFFAAAAVAVAFYRRPYVRKTFVASFFAGLLVVNFVVPVAPAPFVAWGHFAEPTSKVVEHNEIRFVDEHGNELKKDDRLTLSFDAASASTLRDRILNDYSDEKREAVSRYLVLEARNYRDRVEDPPITDAVRYPHHGLTSVWRPELLDNYGEFVGIRIYQMRFVTSDDGTEIVDYQEQVVFESYPLGDVPAREPVPNTEPTRSMNRTAPASLAASPGVSG